MKKSFNPPPAALVGAVSLTALSLAFSDPAAAIQIINGFNGPYNVNNWVFNANGGDGSVNNTGAPNSITLTGNNNGTGGIFTNFTINLPAGGQITFDYVYNTGDPEYDSFGILFNGNYIFIANQDGDTGSFSIFGAEQGDSFGFSIDGNDGCCGRGNATISNFSAPAPVPLETDALPIVISSAFMAGGLWLRRRHKAVKPLDLSPADRVRG